MASRVVCTIVTGLSVVVAQLSLFAQGQAKLNQITHDAASFWSQGLPYITSYTSRDYKVAGQNWAVLQDRNGLIYVGNTYGVLEFDGVKWRLIKNEGNSPIKSLAIDSQGRVYGGGVNDIGLLEPDQTKGMVYRSLLSELDPAQRSFGDVWITHAIKDTIYFISDSHILRWDGKQFRVWREKNIGFSWMGRGALWLQIESKGLHRMSLNGPEPVTEFDASFPAQSVTTGLAHDDQGWTLITSDNKGYVVGQDGLRRQIDYFSLPEGFVYRATRLRDGHYALGCIDGGLYITTSDGHVIKHFTRRDGLTSNTILDVFVDAAGDLWLAADKGVMRMEWDSPLRRFDTALGIEEEVNDVAIFHDRLYAATTAGLYVLSPDQQTPGRQTFVKFPRMEYLTSDLEVAGDHLIVGNYFGLFSIDKRKKIRRLYDQNVHAIGASNRSGDYLLFSTSASVIGELIKEGASWRRGPDTLLLAGRPYNIARTSNGNVLIGTRYNGAYELEYDRSSAASVRGRKLRDAHRLIHYDTTRGLPSMVNGPMALIGNTTVVPSADGLYQLDTALHMFKQFEPVMQHFQGARATAIHRVEPSAGHGFWLTANEGQATVLYRFGNGLLRRVPVGDRFLGQRLESMFELDRITYFATGEGMVAYNPRQTLDDTVVFATNIRSVLINRDSIVFAGHTMGDVQRLGYAYNSPDFEFALPHYELTSANEYQFMLEGYEDHWSKWSPETQAVYTHLPEGKYKFHVRGRNVYGKVAAEDTWTFVILPPVYRSWWAYVLYGALLVIAVRLLIYWRSRHLVEEKVRLEHLVSQRTTEVQVQAERLKEMDVAKSRFYANISHEFRTPLTLILGPLEESPAMPTIDQSRWHIMRRNARRLLELVNQLLDLSKLDAGKMELHVRKNDLRRFIQTICASFESLAVHRDIRFIRSVEIQSDQTWYDSDKVEKIATNLLSNAFKFTPAGGVVFLEAALATENGKMNFVLTVSDNGRGISPEEQEKIFSPFYQGRHGADGQEQGTGLGLSLLKELTVLHHGSVTVRSSVEGGSTFTVTLPVSEVAFSSHELVVIHEPPVVKEFSDTESSVGPVAEPDADPEVHVMSFVHEAPMTNVVDERDTVVVVEDNSDLRSFISSILEPTYTVLTARDGEEGVAIATLKLPDLILTDLMMPRMDGMQLTERVKGDERTSHIPVVLLTARNESASKLEGFRIGADDYLTKPFSAEELLARVGNLIAQRRKLSDLFREKVLVEPTPQQHVSLDEKFLFSLRDAVESSLSDPDFGVEQLAEQACMSRTQLFRKLNALAGISPSEFIRDLRLKRAADLISAKADTVTQIGYRVGFRDQSYFTKCFKKQFGVAPSAYSRP